MDSGVHRSGRRGLAIHVPAAVRDHFHLAAGDRVSWRVSRDGLRATLSFELTVPVDAEAVD